mmetsp:Transcript_24605/g.55432  ORF Transcript_24605/g.55432 Transcript_24605/m.55432 type:complete len:204 (-) Transcript_24605:506-1117(-)
MRPKRSSSALAGPRRVVSSSASSPPDPRSSKSPPPPPPPPATSIALSPSSGSKGVPFFSASSVLLRSSLTLRRVPKISSPSAPCMPASTRSTMRGWHASRKPTTSARISSSATPGDSGSISRHSFTFSASSARSTSSFRRLAAYSVESPDGDGGRGGGAAEAAASGATEVDRGKSAAVPAGGVKTGAESPASGKATPLVRSPM